MKLAEATLDGVSEATTPLNFFCDDFGVLIDVTGTITLIIEFSINDGSSYVQWSSKTADYAATLKSISPTTLWRVRCSAVSGGSAVVKVWGRA